MGGGTGTGAAPVIAEAARRKGVLTVGVVTKPFLFEGTRRMRAAEAGIEELQKHVDTLIVIPNQNLFLVAKAETTFKEAFELADEVLQQGVRSITDLMVMPGLINLDFADVRSVMGEMGKAMMGTGEGEGDNRALQAAEQAIANPLLDGVSMQGAKGVIISIIGGEDMKLLEVDEAANHIRELVDPEANIIWGSAFNPDLDGKIRVSVVATGIEQNAQQAENSSRPLDFSASRGPKRPVLPLPTEDELAEDAAAGGYGAEPAEAPEPPAMPAPEPAMPEPYEPASSDAEEEGDDDTGGGNFASLTGDAIQTEGEGEGDGDGAAEADDDWADTGAPPAEPDTLELTLDEEQAEGAGGDEPRDELLLDASRLAAQDAPLQANNDAASGTAPAAPPVAAGEAEAQAGRRRGLVSSGEEAGSNPAASAGAAGGGSTLFERMANLSRGAAQEEDDEEDEDEATGPSLSIPRFLGRQNNQ